MSEELPVIDKEGALERLDGDEELWGEIVTLCMEDAPNYISALKVALENNDAKDAMIQAHTLKSSVGNIGAEATRNYAMLIENAAKQGDLEKSRELYPKLYSAFQDVISFAKANGFSD